MTRYGGRVVYVTEQTDQFQKFGKTLAWKYELKKYKKSDLNQKNNQIMIFSDPDSKTVKDKTSACQ